MLNQFHAKSVSLLVILARRFCNTCECKNENQLTPAGIYVSCDSPERSKQYKCYCRRSSFQTFRPFTLNFADSLTGQSLIALLNVCHPSLDDFAKISIIFESCIILSWLFLFLCKNSGFSVIIVVPFYSFLNYFA